MSRTLTRRVLLLGAPYLVLAIGFTVFVVYSAPGFMSSDSAEQLMQARGINELSDWHPPLMALEWRILDWIVSGPILMLLIQGALFLSGTYLLLKRAMGAFTASIVSVLVFLFPPVLSVMAVIWKDSQMAAFAIFGVAALTSERRAARFVGIIFLSIALGLRSNGAAAVCPLVLCVLQYRERAKFWMRARPFAVFCAMFIGVQLANAAMRPAKAYAWHRSVAPFDLVGMIKYAPASNDEILEHIRDTHPMETANLRMIAVATYYPQLGAYTVISDRQIFSVPETKSQREAISAAWFRMLIDYPLAYLKHRWAVFRQIIGLANNDVFVPVYVEFAEADWHLAALDHHPARGGAQAILNSLVYDLRNTIIFRPYLYLALGLICLFGARSSAPPVVALLLSGLLYECSLAIAAPSADYRYSHWMVVCVTISLVLIFAERWNRGRANLRKAQTLSADAV
jgi:hypothetical protein